LPEQSAANVSDDDFIVSRDAQATAGTKLRRLLYSSLASWIQTKLFPAFTSFTPTVIATSGSITSVSATGKTLKIGKLVHFQVVITITTNGTGAGSVRITNMPYTAAATSIVAGRDFGTTVKFLYGYLNSGAANLTIQNFDGTYPGANGTLLILSGSYEAV
jgi:hypothetical protein